jgi:hypothetical protein
MSVKIVGVSENVTRLGWHEASGTYYNEFLCYIFLHLLYYESLVTKSAAKLGVDPYP